MQHDYTDAEIIGAWNNRKLPQNTTLATNLRAFLAALPARLPPIPKSLPPRPPRPEPKANQQEAIDAAFLDSRHISLWAVADSPYWDKEAPDRLALAQAYEQARPQSAELVELRAELDYARKTIEEKAAEIASLKAALAESEKQFQDKVYEIGRLLDVCDKAQAELAALRQPIQSDAGISLGQVLHEILDEGLSWDRLLKGDKEQCKLAAQAVVSAARPAIEAECLAQAVRRMEAVPVTEMWNMWGRAKSLTGIRARLIAAANGEGQAVVVNEPPQGEKQPDLSGENKKQAQPWTPAVGDTVRLKSGGPVMTVHHISKDDCIACTHNANGAFEFATLPAACLNPVQS